MSIRAGQLRHSVVIEQSTEAPNAIGEAISTWTTFAKRRASVQPMQGREFWSAKQFNAESNLRMRLRYLSGLTTKMRINWNGRLFDIISIVNADERNHEMIVIVEEEV